jgi:integrase
LTMTSFALSGVPETLGYPYGPYFRLLALTALRRTQACDVSREEIKGDRWIIPGERMKKKLPHLVPITPRIAELLESLPRYNAGPYLFSNDAGQRPIAAFSQMKRALDEAMTKELAKEGRAFVPFVIHDIRRTCRTRFSDTKLVGKIDREIRERLIAHVPAKLVRTYDLHDFEEEKRTALEAWHKALDHIVKPRPALHVTA